MVDFSNAQVVLATSTALLRYYDVIFSLALSCMSSNQDRQKLQKVKSKHKAMFNFKEGKHALEAARIEPAWKSAVSARRLVKASVAT